LNPTRNPEDADAPKPRWRRRERSDEGSALWRGLRKARFGIIRGSGTGSEIGKQSRRSRGLSTVLEEKTAERSGSVPPEVNDFSIHVATANGSGRMSCNKHPTRALVQMAIHAPD